MPKKPILIVVSNRLLQTLQIALQPPGTGVSTGLGLIDRINPRKALESIEAIDATGDVIELNIRDNMGEGHEPLPVLHPQFEDHARTVSDQLEQLVAGDEGQHISAPCGQGKGRL